MSLIREGYTDVNRAFLQAFMSHRVLKLSEVKSIILAILAADAGDDLETALEDITDNIVTSYITTANTAIHDYDLEIRSTLDQISRARLYALVNTTSDELSQIATTHTADEIAFLKRLLDYMFDTNNTPTAEIMAVNTFDALRLNKNPVSQGAETQTQSAGPGLTKIQAEEALAAFVEEGWLERSPAGWYSLSARALMELATYLTQTYNVPPEEEEDSDEEEGRSGGVVERIKMCYGCKEIITVGLRCQNRTCNFRLHNSCADQYFRAQRGGTKRCPTCTEEWTGRDLVGEGAAARRRQSGAVTVNRRQSGASSRAGRRRSTLTQVRPAPRRAATEQEEANEAMDEGGDEDAEGESE